MNSEGSMSSDNDINTNKEDSALENRDKEIPMECASGIAEEALSDGSKDKMVFFWFIF